MKAAIIENGVVVNVATADPLFALKVGWIPLQGDNEAVGIRWLYDEVNGEFTDPNNDEQ